MCVYIYIYIYIYISVDDNICSPNPMGLSSLAKEVISATHVKQGSSMN